MKNILLLRIDENLYFANVAYLEDKIQRYVAEKPGIKHLVLIANAVNEIDASALDSLTPIAHQISRFRRHHAHGRSQRPRHGPTSKYQFYRKSCPGSGLSVDPRSG